MNRRTQIAMSEQEVSALLAAEQTLVCATIGPRGRPHVMPLWYVLRSPAVDGAGAGGEGGSAAATPQVWAWTYAASQKARNLERDPRATLELHAGDLYGELRGLTIDADVVIHRDAAQVAELGREIVRRCSGGAGAPPRELDEADVAMIDQQAPKRIGLQFMARRYRTFDHRKLG